MSQAHILEEWRIQNLERKIQGKPDAYEIHALRSDVDSLERTVRELSAVVDGLRNELQAAQDSLRIQADLNQQFLDMMGGDR